MPPQVFVRVYRKNMERISFLDLNSVVAFEFMFATEDGQECPYGHSHAREVGIELTASSGEKFNLPLGTPEYGTFAKFLGDKFMEQFIEIMKNSGTYPRK